MITQNDIRESALFREAEEIYKALRMPGTGHISEASELSASSDGQHAVFSGALMDQLESVVTTRICQVDLRSGHTRVLTFGPGVDRLPKYSPDGQRVAFLSDRSKPGNFQLYLLNPASGLARAAPLVEGWVEYLHWSPDGRRILLGVAGHGADVAGGQGAIASKPAAADASPWMPRVISGDEDYRWRRVWIYDVVDDRLSRAPTADINIWEASWCGNDRIAAVVSPGPGEGLWYSATLQLVDLVTGRTRELYKPASQLGWPAASASGRHVAIVEAICSDRWFVAGDLRVIDTVTGEVRRIDATGVDVTHTEWRSEDHLLLAGHRGFETVVGVSDRSSGKFREIWASQDLTSVGNFAAVSGCLAPGDCVLIGESFRRAPEVAFIRQGNYEAIRSFGPDYGDHAKVIDAIDAVSWCAPDGLVIQGWVLRPRGPGPHPLVMSVHGGPVWHWRPRWFGRAGVHLLMLLRRGCAIFFPNPRGSSGRGQAFAGGVVGDMGGADTHDYLSGLDHLVREGIADPARLGVMGISYGGFMTSWLITQDQRFAAAVAVSPVTNHVTEHLLSNIPHFVSLFLADSFTNPHGKYFQRSPIMHAHRAKTPTLNICGALDRCTPPEEAAQFHSALQEAGTRSVLITYPQEGHGVKRFPAAIDYAARVVAWFEEHLFNEPK
jgi:dipeptidyl aminopeptidase/acylaminoacyl peptidase